MARFKVLANQCLMVAALFGFFAASSVLTYKAAGAALNAGIWVGGR